MKIGITVVGLDRLASGQRLARVEDMVRRHVRARPEIAARLRATAAMSDDGAARAGPPAGIDHDILVRRR